MTASSPPPVESSGVKLSLVTLGLIHTASGAEPNRYGLENKPALWNGSIRTARRTEPDRARPSVFTGRCLFLLTSRRPILLRSRSNFLGLSACFFFTMSANTLHCKVLINAVHLRLALWDQSYKNYQNRDLKLKLWEEVAIECDSSCKQKCYYLIYWLQFNHVMCWGNNTKVIYNSLSFIRHSIWPSHIISSVCYTLVRNVIINDCFQAVDPHHYWNR
jgi:hypothetical protein